MCFECNSKTTKTWESKRASKTRASLIGCLSQALSILLAHPQDGDLVTEFSYRDLSWLQLYDVRCLSVALNHPLGQPATMHLRVHEKSVRVLPVIYRPIASESYDFAQPSSSTAVVRKGICSRVDNLEGIRNQKRETKYGPSTDTAHPQCYATPNMDAPSNGTSQVGSGIRC